MLARRLGLELEDDESGFPAVRWQGFTLSSAAIVHAGLEKVLSACAPNGAPRQARLVLPASVSDAAKRLLLRRLAGFGVGRCVVALAPMVALKQAGIELAAPATLVVEVLALETRLSLVSEKGKIIATAATLDANYAAADQALAAVFAAVLPVTGCKPTAEWRAALLAVARSARRVVPDGPWRLQTGAQATTVLAGDAGDALANISESLAISCDTFARAHGLDIAEIPVVVVPEEPLWVGLAETFARVLGRESRLIAPDLWLRLRGLGEIPSG